MLLIVLKASAREIIFIKINLWMICVIVDRANILFPNFVLLYISVIELFMHDYIKWSSISLKLLYKWFIGDTYQFLLCDYKKTLVKIVSHIYVCKCGEMSPLSHLETTR